MKASTSPQGADTPQQPAIKNFFSDLSSGIVVFLVALPLCLGVALASNAPLFSGIVAGIIGGLVVGLLSGSHVSVSGPAAGLTAIVAAQIALLGSFRAFLLAVLIGGVIQVGLGVLRLGAIAAFIPSSVIKGLLAAIGIILILKQLPHAFGHDPDPLGDLSFAQPDHENTFSEILATALHIQPGAALVGLLSIGFLVMWDRIKTLKKSLVPAPLVVVVLAVIASEILRRMGGAWEIEQTHLVQVPIANGPDGLLGLFVHPDFSQLRNPTLYRAGATIAIVASLETLLNLEAVDKIDKQQRVSPPNRELIAQGAGNMVSGLIGGLPVTSVIVRSSVNVEAGSRTKLATILHGAFLAVSALALPTLINRIPLAALAAILIMTGIKLASPSLVIRMWKEGYSQFLPFAVTVVAIVLTDLLIGIGLGLVVAVAFILRSNLRRPLHRVMEKHVGGDVLRIELANQVSFLNRAVIAKTLAEVPRGGHVLIDARNTDYIDPDIRDLIEDFVKTTAPAHGVEVSLLGFNDKTIVLEDRIQYVDFSSQDVRETLTPMAVLRLLEEGNKRFLAGQRLTRDFTRIVDATAAAQYPMAVVLSCIDSRTPAEHVFDLGLGDIFNVRIAGNVAKDKVLASMEFGCAVAGAKLIVVMGHTSCGAVKASVDLYGGTKTAAEATGCEHLDVLVNDIHSSIKPGTCKAANDWESDDEKRDYVDSVARRHVLRTMDVIRQRSRTLNALIEKGQIDIVGAVYDVRTGKVEFFKSEPGALALPDSHEAHAHEENMALLQAGE